ncbi:MAG: hypothetical protein QM786_11380 [Breznakibacter sp.]
MKKLLFVSVLLTAMANLLAQKHDLSFVFGSTPNDVYRDAGIVGGPSYTGKRSTLLGIGYFYTLSSRFDLATGLEYSKSRFEISSNLIPGSATASHREHINLLSFPLGVRTNFLKYFFLYTGTSADVDLNPSENDVASMTGLGWNLGLGAKLNYQAATAFINPFFQQHAAISLASAGDSREKLLIYGCKFGIGYRF